MGAAPSSAAPPAEQAAPARVKITEIFLSIQGEADAVDWPTVFVRLTGCPLRCQYCDTQYAFYGGEWLGLDDVLGKVASFQTRHVCVTGGEPLAQKGCFDLLRQLSESACVSPRCGHGRVFTKEVPRARLGHHAERKSKFRAESALSFRCRLGSQRRWAHVAEDPNASGSAPARR